jgi:AsmA protein
MARIVRPPKPENMTLSAVLGFKRLAFAVGALVLGVFGALAVVSFLIPKDQVREAVKSEIRAATGLDPLLRGDVSVSLFPYGQVTMTDVALGEGADEPPLQAARLVARLSFLPLLLGRIDIADITLAEPRILISVDDSGRTNWGGLLSSLGRAVEPEAPQDLRVYYECRPVAGLAGDLAELRRHRQCELSQREPRNRRHAG